MTEGTPAHSRPSQSVPVGPSSRALWCVALVASGLAVIAALDAEWQMAGWFLSLAAALVGGNNVVRSWQATYR